MAHGLLQNSLVRASFSSRWRVLAACFFLAAATLAVYWPARHYDFVAYDDDDYVYQNSMVQKGLTWQGVEWAFVDRQANNWHPLTWLSHMADCQMFGLNAGGPHMVNVGIHCADAVLVFLLLQSLMRRRKDAPAGTDFFWRNLFVAALFALHPLRVESVAWISERKDLLSAFFGLLTLLCYSRYALSGRPPGHSVAYRLAVIFYICALLSKPMLVAMPFLLLLLDYWPLGRLAEKAGTGKKENIAAALPSSPAGQGGIIRRWREMAGIRGVLLEKLPFFLLGAAFSVITLIAERPGLPPQNMPLFERVEGVAVNYLGYVEKLFWPANLSFLYLRPDSIPLAQFILALAVLFGISALAFAWRRRCPALLTGWLWFLVVMLPVCGIVSIAWLCIADRYTYLSSIGVYLMVVWGLADLSRLWRSKVASQRFSDFRNSPSSSGRGGVEAGGVETTGEGFPFAERGWQIFLASAGVAVVVVCAVLSRQALGSWRNTETLYEHALKVDPNNYVAKQNLHIYLFEKAHPTVRPPPPDSH